MLDEGGKKDGALPNGKNEFLLWIQKPSLPENPYKGL